jgi:hypothetical protein
VSEEQLFSMDEEEGMREYKEHCERGGYYNHIIFAII